MLKKKQSILSLEDIAFEGRNKEYGAYVLIKTYRRRLRNSFLLALGIFTLAILIMGGWMMIPWLTHKPNVTNLYMVKVDYNSKLVTLLQQPPSLPSKQKQQPKISLKLKIKNEVTEIEKVEPLVNVIPSEQAVKEDLQKTIILFHKKTDTVVFAPPVAKPKDDTIYYALDSPPIYPGGNDALYLFIYSNLRYPVGALHQRLHGTVNVAFIINSDGSIGKVSIIKGCDPLLDGEAARVIASMSKWKPAMYKGKSIASMQIIPISFTISM